MKTYNEITKILVDKRLPAPWFILDELAERDEVIERLNQQLTEKDATIKELERQISYLNMVNTSRGEQLQRTQEILHDVNRNSALGEGDKE
jgi:predicted RNase H-like nuclease (RuvC/YqgF family)